LAISKQKKETILAHYLDLLNKSQAVILVEYTGATMKDLDNIRSKVREAGGEFHVVKNTLAKLALDKAGRSILEGYLEKSTAMGFALKDSIKVVKAVNDFAKTLETIKIKGGYLDAQAMTAREIKALAELPPMPVLRSQLLGVLLAPASKLVRTLVEPGRQVASVVRAYSEKAAPAAA
jgi:large subunit ribosomal protein L10